MKENNQIRVLVVPSWYPCKDNNINGIFFKEQAEALAQFKIKVSVIYAETQCGLKNVSLSKLKSHHFQTIKNIENEVLTYRYMGYSFPPKITILKNKFWISKMLQLAKKYIEENGMPDIIHAHSALWGGYVAYLLSKKYCIPYVVTEHFSGLARGLITDQEKKYVSKIFSNAKKVICVSNSLKKLVLKNYNNINNIIVISNMVNTHFFKNNSYKNKYKDIFTFLNICFLKKNKGVDILIKAFYKAFSKNEKVILRIGGDGEESSNLKKLVKKLGMEKKVIFLGMLDRNSVKTEMKMANCFVLSSYFETFSVVIIEALSTGCPVIATKCGGPEDILNEYVGILTEKGDIDKLCEAMKYIYNNYYKYNSDLIREYTIKKYSRESVSEKIINLYKSIIL